MGYLGRCDDEMEVSFTRPEAPHQVTVLLSPTFQQSTLFAETRQQRDALPASIKTESSVFAEELRLLKLRELQS